MIHIFADGALAYDSRLESYDLQGLRITTGPLPSPSTAIGPDISDRSSRPS